MKTLRYWTSHPEHDAITWMRNFQLPPPEYNLVYDSDSPDYLFATEHIYTDNLLRKRFKKLLDGRRVVIYYTSECIFPDMNIFDYAVVFDRTLSLDDRIARRHPISFTASLFSAELSASTDFDPAAELKRKSGFCNFIYSNPKAHPRRDQIFKALSNYKRVDSLGPHLNNVGNTTSRAASNWGDALVEMKRPYKFSIAAENAAYPGYVTEKLISSFLAHTIPIYWGAAGCTEEFNPEAFIDASKLSDSELVNIVSKIDSDDALWAKMAATEPLTLRQQIEYQDANRRYSDFCRHIFDQDIAEAKRVPAGYWPDNYRRYFMSARGVSYSLRRRLLGCLGRDTELFQKGLSWVNR